MSSEAAPPPIVTTWPIRRMRVAELVPSPYNPRRIEPQQLQALRASLTRFGLVDPLIVNETTGNLVGGHQRLEILKETGIEEVDVTVVRMSLEEEKALNLTLNNPEAQGEFTAETHGLLEDLRGQLPDAYDALRLFKIEPPDDALEATEGREKKTRDASGLETTPVPYESFNYVLLIFRNEIDWTAAIEHFQLKPVVDLRGEKGVPHIGLGRVVEGRDYLARVMRERERREPPA